jgi:hypothetical protein
MSEDSKRELEMDRAREIVKQWKTCSLSDLSWACDRIESAILLLIMRTGEA